MIETHAYSVKPQRTRRGAQWTGYVLSTSVTLILVADGLVNLLRPNIISAEMALTGFPLERSATLGVICLVCAVLYAIPQTCVLGAICVTGFLGGAICTRFRVGDFGSVPQLVSFLIGIIAWLGLYLRLAPLRACLPLVRYSYAYAKADDVTDQQARKLL